jgi:hypothetical protein
LERVATARGMEEAVVAQGYQPEQQVAATEVAGMVAAEAKEMEAEAVAAVVTAEEVWAEVAMGSAEWVTATAAAADAADGQPAALAGTAGEEGMVVVVVVVVEEVETGEVESVAEETEG